MLKLNKTNKIARKNQEFGPQISHKPIHGKMMLGFKNQA